MWIVSVALRRPYTFIVAALVIALLGAFTIARTPGRPSAPPSRISPAIRRALSLISNGVRGSRLSEAFLYGKSTCFIGCNDAATWP